MLRWSSLFVGPGLLYKPFDLLGLFWVYILVEGSIFPTVLSLVLRVDLNVAMSLISDKVILMCLNYHTLQPSVSLAFHSLFQHFGIQSLAPKRVQHDLLNSETSKGYFCLLKILFEIV